MADPTTSTPLCFVANTETLEDMLKTPTISLVHLSQFKNRRVELAEQRDRETAEKLELIGSGGGGGGSASSSWEASVVPTGRGGKRTKKRKKVVKGKLSFAGEGDGDDSTMIAVTLHPPTGQGLPALKVLTKNTLLREAQERETLRREFLALQKKIKNEEIRIPFVFYDSTYVAPPTGEGVTIKKGEAVWLFPEHARGMAQGVG